MAIEFDLTVEDPIDDAGIRDDEREPYESDEEEDLQSKRRRSGVIDVEAPALWLVDRANQAREGAQAIEGHEADEVSTGRGKSAAIACEVDLSGDIGDS